MSLERHHVAQASSVIRGAALWFCYAAAVLWLTWPLGKNLGTHLAAPWLAARFDPMALAWALAHQCRALTEHPLTFPHGNIFHPEPFALFYGEAGFGALPYFLPVFLLSDNPTLALNFTTLAGVTLTACTLHLVVLRWTGSNLGGLIAAGTFLMTRWVLWLGVPSTPTYAVLQYLPLIIFIAASSTWSFAREASLVVLVFLQGLTSSYVAAATLGPLFLIATGHLPFRRTRQIGKRLLRAAAISSFALLACYSGYLRVRADNPSLLEQTLWRSPFETLLPFGPISYWVPAAVPSAALALAVLWSASLLWRRTTGRPATPLLRVWVHVTAWVLCGLMLSVGPTVWWQGQRLSVPLLDAIPIYRVLRVFSRLGIGALIGFSILAGLAFAQIDARIRGGFARGRPVLRLVARAAVAASALAVMYVEYISGTTTPLVGGWRNQTFYTQFNRAFPPLVVPSSMLPMGPLVPSYPLMETVHGDGTLIKLLQGSTEPLLEVPVAGQMLKPFIQGALGSPEFQAEAMYRSIFHRRPLLNGYNSYWPARWVERMALALQLPNPEAIAKLREETGLQMILVHSGRMNPEDRRRWGMATAEADAPLRLVARDGDDWLLEVTTKAAASEQKLSNVE